MDYQEALEISDRVNAAGKCLEVSAGVINGAAWGTYLVLVTDRDANFAWSDTSDQYGIATAEDVEYILSTIAEIQE